jgi:cytochrome c oxidase assembly protein subunit 15
VHFAPWGLGAELTWIDMHNIWLHRYAVLLACCTLFLLIAGAAVTSHDAGLSVPDWPLSYGRIMPEMTGGIFYEHGHRMVATAVGFMTIVLAVWLWRADERDWMKRLGLAALALVVVQGILGGLTVRFMLPKAISITHACIAELFFSLTVAIAVFTSRSWLSAPTPLRDNASLRPLGVLVPVATLAQVALGAAFRHRALNIIPHVAGAMVVTALVLYAGIVVYSECRNHDMLRRTAAALLSITVLQVFLGIAAYISRISMGEGAAPTSAMLFFTISHVAVGASTMAASVALAIQIRRSVLPSGLALANRAA